MTTVNTKTMESLYDNLILELYYHNYHKKELSLLLFSAAGHESLNLSWTKNHIRRKDKLFCLDAIYVVILTDTNRKKAEGVMERLEQRIGNLGKVIYSLVSFPEDATCVEKLVDLGFSQLEARILDAKAENIQLGYKVPLSNIIQFNENLHIKSAM